LATDAFVDCSALAVVGSVLGNPWSFLPISWAAAMKAITTLGIVSMIDLEDSEPHRIYRSWEKSVMELRQMPVPKESITAAAARLPRR